MHMNNPFAGLTPPLFFVGVGNTLKGDDGAGALASDRMIAAGVPALNCGDSPENYIRAITSRSSGSIVFIDAVEMHAVPGTLRLFAASDIAVTGVFTHGMSLAMLAELITTETKLPVYLAGIQPRKVSLGEGISTEVENGINKLLQLVVELKG